MQSNTPTVHPDTTFPRFEILTSFCGSEVYDSTVPDSVLDRIPYAEGPGDIKPYLARISSEYYVLGVLDVRYDDEQWSDIYPDKAVVRNACEKATDLLRAQATPDIIVYPCDFNSWPGQGIVSVAIPLGKHSTEDVKTRLAAVFQDYALVHNVLHLAT